ncbi:MAG TPA: cache domain-containing protein, partial [Saprospiraceae bacterium]|nr:cache domain-containing protein [Saprospiraceae bacterium]
TSVEFQKGYLPMFEPSRGIVKDEEYWFHRAMNSQDAVTYDDTKMLKALVADAAALIRQKGELAFPDFRVPGSRWRQGETYIFVLDLNGHMLVHADADMENTLQIDLKDIHGKPIIKGLLSAVTSIADKTEGWYHYQWPVPGGLLPRWKSSYVQLVKAPSGKSYVVGSGMYNDRMEREFVVSAVHDAVGQIEKNKDEAFRLFHDPTSPFIAKDAYIFVIDEKGTDLVNPGFPSLEGRNLMDLKDSQGKLLIRDMFDLVQDYGSGWVDYMWPKPGESISTQKSTYVSRAKVGDQFFLVGCGVYLADAPKVLLSKKKMNASELMTLVREGAKEFEKRGEKAYPDFRKKESKWFHDDSYFFVWTMDGKRVFNAANPSGEGLDVSTLKDVLHRPYGQMFLQAGTSVSGEGWIHYMHPEPGDIFPTWKSTFVKRVTFPSGKQHLVGCGIYNMQMNKAFIEDVVNRASILVAERGQEAFPTLRDKTGPYLFMDTYVFVDNPEGVELVNPAQPSIEGVNIKDFKDARGKYLGRQYIDAAMKQGSAWVEYYWYKPGDNIPVKKYTFVRRVEHGNETYIVGAGLYMEEENGDEQKVE